MKRAVLISIIGILALLGCANEEGNHPCYDASIIHDGNCQDDCPGFEGCDGKTYCNECYAARNGIGPK